MDKETLSNYGWIVILVLILAVLLALATPFGNFIAGAFKATTAGFFSVNQNAMNAGGITIPGQNFDDTSSDETPVALGCDTLYWDGNMDGLYCETSEFLTNILGPDCICYQVWNQPIDLDQFSEIKLSYIYEDSVETETRNLEDINHEQLVDGFYIMDGGLIVIPTDITNPETGESIYVGKPGIYFAIQEWGRTLSLTIPGYTGFPHSDNCGH